MEDVDEIKSNGEELLQSIMTSCDDVYKKEFFTIVSKSTNEVHEFVNELTSDLDLFVEIIRDKQGLNRVMKIFGISEDINTILLYSISITFLEIMTHEHGYDLMSRVLNVCNIDQKKLFCQITYHHALDLVSDVHGCVILRKVITLADDFFKGEFLDLIAKKAHMLSMDDLGINSLIQHVLKLNFTRRSTQDNTRLHKLMAEFDEIVLASDRADQMHNLVSKLTSDSDLFVELTKTRRGSLMVQIMLGEFEEIDTMFFEAIRQRFTDFITGCYGDCILFRTIHVLKRRGITKMYLKIPRIIAVHALYLTKHSYMGYYNVQDVINFHNKVFTELIACALQCHYIELSFLKHGSSIVKKLVGDDTTKWPLMFIVMEIVKCDEDTLVKLAKDEYGNKVLKKTLEVAKRDSFDLFGDLVEKLKPFVDSLRGTQGENIAAIIHLESSSNQTLSD